jgi:hypothetical protein
MFELIMLSTMVAFNVDIGCRQRIHNATVYDCGKIECQAFAEIVELKPVASCQEWMDIRKANQSYYDEQEARAKGTKYDGLYSSACEKEIASVRLVGLCDDGIVRWSKREVK